MARTTSSRVGFGLAAIRPAVDHDHAGRAEAALRGEAFEEGLLDRMQALRRRQPFDGVDARILDRLDRQQAGSASACRRPAPCRRRRRPARSRGAFRSGPGFRAAPRAAWRRATASIWRSLPLMVSDTTEFFMAASRSLLLLVLFADQGAADVDRRDARRGTRRWHRHRRTDRNVMAHLVCRRLDARPVERLADQRLFDRRRAHRRCWRRRRDRCGIRRCCRR